jgi:beta-fructofuranosidase
MLRAMKRMTRREFAAGVAAAGAWAAVPGTALAEVARAAGVGGVGAAGAGGWPPEAKRLAADRLRPQFHLLPKYGWMNDPNAPVYWRGKYHMFFQYNPGAAVWGDMHWAHAWSEDMVRWKHLPVALSPTEGGYDAAGCFTGSFIEDANGKAAIVYTGVANAAAADATLRDGVSNLKETQCFAGTDDPMLLSWDQGRGAKAPAPVIAKPPAGMEVMGFRDPSAWRDGDWYYMTVGSGVKRKGGMVLLYRSPARGKSALLEWEYLHPLAEGEWNGKVSANAVDTGEMWECPDFFALDGWWVLLYSTAGEVIWETGRLVTKNGDQSTMRFERVKRGLLDAGAYYAPKSQVDAKGNRILWGWIQETRPAAEYAAAGWAGCMSLPRRLNVAADGVLEMRVDAAVEELRGEKVAVDLRKVAEVPVGSGAVGMRSVMEPGAGILLTDASGVWAAIELRQTNGLRRLSVKDKVLELGSGGPVEVRGYFDGSVLEVIADNRQAVTVRSYGPEARTEGQADAVWGQVRELEVWKMKAISGDRLTT